MSEAVKLSLRPSDWKQLNHVILLNQCTPSWWSLPQSLQMCLLLQYLATSSTLVPAQLNRGETFWFMKSVLSPSACIFSGSAVRAEVCVSTGFWHCISGPEQCRSHLQPVQKPFRSNQLFFPNYHIKQIQTVSINYIIYVGVLNMRTVSKKVSDKYKSTNIIFLEGASRWDAPRAGPPNLSSKRRLIFLGISWLWHSFDVGVLLQNEVRTDFWLVFSPFQVKQFSPFKTHEGLTGRTRGEPNADAPPCPHRNDTCAKMRFCRRCTSEG